MNAKLPFDPIHCNLGLCAPTPVRSFLREPEIAGFDPHGLFVVACRTLRCTSIANFQSSCGYAKGRLQDIEKYGHNGYLYTCRQHNEELGISRIPAWVAFPYSVALRSGKIALWFRIA